MTSRMQRQGGGPGRRSRFVARHGTVLAVLAALHAGNAWAQLTFDTGSSEADGDIVFCQSGDEEIWDPQGLDTDRDGIYEFGTITIPATCAVRLRAEKLGPRPVSWLASGPVVIDGTLGLGGWSGHANTLGSIRSPAAPGPGGFAGGLGKVAGVGSLTNGFGPGAGNAGSSAGGGAGHWGAGSCYNCSGGPAYGNVFLLPLVGGSGGGGSSAGGGGAGGGAILIASSQSITVNGSILARGGAGRNASSDNYGSGGGSGGAIRLVAPVVSGSGTLSVSGGSGGYYGYENGSKGRIRVESLDPQFTGSATSDAIFVTLAPTTTLFSGLVDFPVLRVATVGGQAVPQRPTGGFTPADVTINTPDPVLLEIEAENVPEGTLVTVEVHSESVDTSIVSSTPLTGTDTFRTATALATIDAGFSLVTLRADFGP